MFGKANGVTIIDNDIAGRSGVAQVWAEASTVITVKQNRIGIKPDGASTSGQASFGVKFGGALVGTIDGNIIGGSFDAGVEITFGLDFQESSAISEYSTCAAPHAYPDTSGTGIPDVIQIALGGNPANPHKVVFPSDDGHTVTLAAPVGRLVNVCPSDAPAMPAGMSLPAGQFAFELTAITPGGPAVALRATTTAQRTERSSTRADPATARRSRPTPTRFQRQRRQRRHRQRRRRRHSLSYRPARWYRMLPRR